MTLSLSVTIAAERVGRTVAAAMVIAASRSGQNGVRGAKNRADSAHGKDEDGVSPEGPATEEIVIDRDAAF